MPSLPPLTVRDPFCPLLLPSDTGAARVAERAGYPAARTGVALGLLLCAALCGAQTTDARISTGPTNEELAFATQRAASAQAYAACLLSEKDAWVATPDYGRCDAARETYAGFLPLDAAGVVVGCLEEKLLGTARLSAAGCAAFRERFPAQPAKAADAETSP